MVANIIFFVPIFAICHPKKYVFKLEGMSCSNCALSIEKHLQKNKIVEFNIDFANNELSVARNKNIQKTKLLN